MTLAVVTALAGGIAAGASFAAPDSPAASPLSPSSQLSDPNAIAVVPGLPAPPIVSAPAWAVYDGVDGTLLAGRAIGTERPMASLAKLVTALVVIARTTGSEQVTASKAAQASGDGSEIAMKAGQKYTVETLLQAMLIHSTNDAAVALAEYVGGDEASFVKLMQQTVKNMKLEHTTITNATGLDQPTPPTSTPSDLFEIARTAMKDARVRTAVAMPSITVARTGEAPIKLLTRNELLGVYDGVDGVKTGFTDKAGNNLALRWTAPAGSKGQVYVILMGDATDTARFADARALLDWAKPLRSEMLVTDAGSRIASVPVAGSRRQTTLYLADDIKPTLRVGQHLTERIVIPRTLQAPLRAGDNVGRYQLLADDKVVGSSDLYIAKNFSKPSTSERIRRYAGDWRLAWKSGFSVVRKQSHRFFAYWGYA